MNKSQIFTQAHKLAKSVHVAGESYRVTFGAALKIVIAESKAPKTLAERLLDAGAKVWEQHGFKRIYMTCAQFNKVTKSNLKLNDDNNKIFYDFATNAIMRSYRGKKPNIEVQY